MMRTDLAFCNLASSQGKTALSVAGISIAVVLMFMQLGFRGSVESTATTVYSRLDFDLVARSPDYLHFVMPGQLERDLLHQLASQNEVRAVTPLHASMGNWDNPRRPITRGVVIIGVDPDASTFLPQFTELTDDLLQLSNARDVLIDRLSTPEFGPRNQVRFDRHDIGVTTTVAEKEVKISGLFTLGAGLTANGALLTSEQGFDRLLPFDAQRYVSYGLVKLHGTPTEQQLYQVAQELEQRFATADGSPRIEFLTRQQAIDRELTRWMAETPIGFVFTLGVIISCIVGAMIVYMILATDVAKRLNEYATLKAMGYTNVYLSWVVLRQAVYLALIAFAGSLLVSLLLYEVTAAFAGVPIVMTATRVGFVLCLSVSMCIGSGLLAMRKLWQAEPADLF